MPQTGRQRPRTAATGAPRSLTTPGAGPVRRAVELRSATLLVWLSGLRRWIVPVFVLSLLGAAVALPSPWAGIPVLLVLAGVGWLSYLSWPAVTGSARVVRLVTLGLVAAIGVQRTL